MEFKGERGGGFGWDVEVSSSAGRDDEQSFNLSM